MERQSIADFSENKESNASEVLRSAVHEKAHADSGVKKCDQKQADGATGLPQIQMVENKVVEVNNAGGKISFGIKWNEPDEKTEPKKKDESDAANKDVLAVKKLAEEIVKTGKIPAEMKGLWNSLEIPSGVLNDTAINIALEAMGSSKRIDVKLLMGPINSSAEYDIKLTDKDAVLDEGRMTISHLAWVHRDPKDTSIHFAPKDTSIHFAPRNPRLIDNIKAK